MFCWISILGIGSHCSKASKYLLLPGPKCDMGVVGTVVTMPEGRRPEGFMATTVPQLPCGHEATSGNNKFVDHNNA